MTPEQASALLKAFRHALTIVLDAIEKYLEIEPRTSQLRKMYKAQH